MKVEKVRRRRKRNPERTERRKQLAAWSRAVRERAGGKCEWCGAEKYVQAHHIVDKRFAPLRYDLANGISLCAGHHKFYIGASAHQNPIIVFAWLLKYRPHDVMHLVDLMPNGKEKL